MENQIDIEYVKGIFNRRKKIFFWLPTSILFVFILVAFLLPPVYRSEVGIVIEEQQIPEKFVQSTITSFVEERIRTITKQIMSRSKLLEIAEKHSLYKDRAGEILEEEVVNDMRKNIERTIETANIGKSNVVTIGFTLSFSGRNPDKLQAVANELAYLYLEEEHRAKEKSASATTDFLQQEKDAFKEQITVYENRISEFKKNHIGQLPQNYTGNIQSLERLERQYQDIERNIRSLEERKLYLNAQIANVEPMTPIIVDGQNVMMNPAERLKRLRLELVSQQARYSDKHPDILKLRKEISELEAQVGDQDLTSEKLMRLSDLSGKLSAMKGELGEKHPDVIKLSKEYNALAKDVAREASETASLHDQEVKPDNPVYINLMTQIVALDAQMEAYLDEQSQIEKDIETYRMRLENAPVVEAEYNDLTRDLEATQSKYNDLSAKLMQAKVAQGMETSQRGERFTISEPASVPGKPYKPNRKLIIMLGFVLAIGFSIGVIAIQESLDVSLKSIADVNMSLGLPVLSVLPMIQTEEELKRIKKRRWLYAVGMIILLIVAIIIIHQFVMPIDVIWTKILNRMEEAGIR